MNAHTAPDAVAEAIRSRRTNLRMDRDRPVAHELLDSLIDLAVWAPNHRLTEPWRFAVFTGAGRGRLGAVTADFQEAMGMTDPDRLAKTRGKFLRGPAVVLIGAESPADASDEIRSEDRDAVAAGVQNLLLGATALGLASYWGSGAVCQAPEVRTLAGFTADTTVVAAVYVGWPIGPVPVPSRNTPVINRISE